MNPCQSVAESLLAYRAGALEEEAHEHIRGHLASCPRCRELEAQVAELPAVLNESIDPPPELWSQIMKSQAANKDNAKPMTPALIPNPNLAVRVRQDCVYCRGSLFAARVHCADCLARYHESCFIANKGCGVLGCAGREFLKPQGLEETSRRMSPGHHHPLGRARKPLLALAALTTVVGASFLAANKYVDSLPKPEEAIGEVLEPKAPPPPPPPLPAQAESRPARPEEPEKTERSSAGAGFYRGVTLERRSGEALAASSLRFAFPKSEPARPDLIFESCGQLHLNVDDTFPWRVADLGAPDQDLPMGGAEPSIESWARERLAGEARAWRYRSIEPRAGHAYALQYRGSTQVFYVIEKEERALTLSWRPGGFSPAEDFEFPNGEEEWRSPGLELCDGLHSEK